MMMSPFDTDAVGARPSKRWRKDDDAPDAAGVAELQARMVKARAAAGPVLAGPPPPAADPAHPLAADDVDAEPALDPLGLLGTNADLANLTMSQLEQEQVRLAERMRVVNEHVLRLRECGVRRRRRCSSRGCVNVAQKGGVCKRHGAHVPRKKCSVEGCTTDAKNRGVCHKHGAKYRLCRVEGCRNKIQQGGVCCRHGAKRAPCRMKGCRKGAQKDGLCDGHWNEALEAEEVEREGGGRGQQPLLLPEPEGMFAVGENVDV